MQTEQTGIEQLKAKMRATWTAGDFGQIARYMAKGAEDFVARIGILPGAEVLDVACGTGNLSLPAARRGAKVTGVDIAPNSLEQARQNAAKEGLEASFDEGDAESLPYRDGQFDVVMSMFGAMFAPRPDRVAAELLRVCRSGGTIAMANWTQQSFVAELQAAAVRFVSPPQGLPSPAEWGDESIVRQRLGGGTSAIRVTRQLIDLDYPFGPAAMVEHFRRYFGPVLQTFSQLDSTQQAEYAKALEQVWSQHNEATGDRTLVRAEYLEVIATRA